MIIKRLTLAVISGVVPSLSVLPQASETVELGFTAEDVACAAGVMDLIGFDVYLNLRYVLNRADSLLPAGSEVAYDQICLNEADLPVFRNKSGLPLLSRLRRIATRSLWNMLRSRRSLQPRVLLLQRLPRTSSSFTKAQRSPYSIRSETGTTSNWPTAARAGYLQLTSLSSDP